MWIQTAEMSSLSDVWTLRVLTWNRSSMHGRILRFPQTETSDLKLECQAVVVQYCQFSVRILNLLTHLGAMCLPDRHLVLRWNSQKVQTESRRGTGVRGCRSRRRQSVAVSGCTPHGGHRRRQRLSTTVHAVRLRIRRVGELPARHSGWNCLGLGRRQLAVQRCQVVLLYLRSCSICRIELKWGHGVKSHENWTGSH